MSIVIKKNFYWYYASLTHLHCQPKKFQKGNVFSHVSLSFCLSTEGSHVTYMHLLKFGHWGTSSNPASLPTWAPNSHGVTHWPSSSFPDLFKLFHLNLKGFLIIPYGRWIPLRVRSHCLSDSDAVSDANIYKNTGKGQIFSKSLWTEHRVHISVSLSLRISLSQCEWYHW